MRNNFELDRLKKLKLEKLKKDLERKKNLPHLYGHKLYKWQREFFESKNKMLFLNSANQVGKDLWNETLIPVPNGFKKLKDIVVGDLVFGSDGNTCEVIDIPWDQDNNTYKIIFDDGSEVICGPHHEWICKGPEDLEWQIKTVNNLIDFYIKDQFHVIPITQPLCNMTEKEKENFKKVHKHERLVVKIIPWKRLRTRCLTVSSPDHSFLCTKSHIVTHNSSIQIKKMIHWATETSLWPELWPTPPRLFWYLYPSLRIADSEFLKKWKPEFLPQDQNDPKYGWTKSNNALGDIEAIHFHSGVSIYFKSYMTNEELLQTGSVWYLGFDEEMPIDLWPELVSRVGAPNIQGYISGVFTPTLSQQFWYDVMEERGTDKELLKGAHKLTTSLFDCTVYEDNTPSLWTREMITQRINSLPSQEEVQRRIYGRFIMSTSGRKFPSFNRDRNYKVNGKLPDDWIYFVGIDSGSGGTGAGHPAAITFLAVNPTYTEGRITMVWKGTPENVDGEDKSTTAGDILRKYLELSRDKNIAKAVFDFADADLGIIAERNGIALERANKSTSGVDLINTLFKNQILSIDINRATNNEELVGEFINLKKETRKTNAKDDTSDSARYAINEVPWDLSVISADSIVKVPNRHRLAYKDIDERRKSFDQPQLKPNEMILAEMEDLNELYDE